VQPTAQSKFSGAFFSGWRRFFYASRRLPRSRGAKPLVEQRTASRIDPIALTIMAVDRLGPARLRAVFHGVPVTIAAPDAETVEIFRAALAQMAKVRPTDRLIRVELAAERQRVGLATTSRPGRSL